MKRFLSILCAVLSTTLTVHAGGDPFEQMARKLADKSLPKLTEKKVAVLPFEYMDKRESPGGRIVAEKITNRLVELGQFTVIERSMVEKVIEELKFQSSGAINPETAKELGKGLGVEAIITGTLEDGKYGKTEISARLIKTETYEICAAATSKVPKTWNDGGAPEAPSPATPQYSAAKRAAGPSNVRGFFDFLFGSGNAKMDLSFQNNSFQINQTELNISGLPVNPFKTISFENLQTKPSAPLGLRFGAFGDVFGGDFEISTYKHAMKSQNTSYKLNGLNRGSFRFGADEYIRVSALNMAGDLLFRIPTSDMVYPYLGLGMGLSINTVSSNNVKSNSGGFVTTNLSETAPGFTFKIPVGVRARFGDRFGMFAEWRYFINTFSFSRNRAGETDKITLTGSQLLLGLSLLF